MRSEIRQGLNELRKHGIYIVFFTKGRKSYLTPPASLVILQTISDHR